MTDLPILYSFRRCPYAMRARMAIVVSGIRVELREVVLRDKPPELIEASAKATVPVLVLPDGKVIEESLDVMRWALGQNDPEDWLDGEDADLIEQNDGPFKAALDRYKYPHRYGLDDSFHDRAKGFAMLAALDEKLADAPFLGGERRKLTDIAIFPFVRQFAATDHAWFDEHLPGLQQWLQQMLASDLFANIMLRYPRWQSGDARVIFP